MITRGYARYTAGVNEMPISQRLSHSMQNQTSLSSVYSPPLFKGFDLPNLFFNPSQEDDVSSQDAVYGEGRLHGDRDGRFA